MRSRRSVVAFSVVWSWLVLFVWARPARAEPPEPEDEAVRPTLREPVERSGATGRLAIDLAGAVGVTESRTVLSLGLLLGGTFDDLFVPPRFAASAALAKEPGDDPEPGRAEGAAAPDAPPALRALDGALARGAVRAALTASQARATSERLDDLSARARASGAVPELRVRIARVVDEGQALSPTEYDPDRVTATGGTSLWLEGRATFQLDRLVFASDEIAIERLRLERAKLERELVREVADALGAYERARAAACDEAADAPTRMRAEIDLAVLEAKLDVLTNGWFTEHASVGGEPAVRGGQASVGRVRAE